MQDKVRVYFQKQTPEHQLILEQLRTLLLNTFPSIVEDFQWGVPIYDGGKFYLVALKNQINLGVSIVGLSNDEIACFEGNGKTTLHIKVFNLLSAGEQVSIIKLLTIVKNKAGIPK